MRASTCVFLVSLAVSWVVTPAAGAQMSREELLELVDSGTDASVIVSAIERDCVDFEMDARAVSELAPLLPRRVIQAAIDCGTVPPEGRLCRFYRALTTDPMLEDFPVVVEWFTEGHLRLLEVSSGIWLEERGVKGFKNRFRSIGEHGTRHMAAVAAIKDLPGVRNYHFDSSPTLSSAELAAMQRDAVLEECSRRARLRIITEPFGAKIFIDGEPAGRSPESLELLPGDHLLEIEAPNFEVYSEQLLLRDGERREVVAKLQRQGSLNITSEPSEAVVVVDGSIAGHTPVEVFVDGGLHRVRVVHRGRPPYEEEIGVGRGEPHELEVDLGAPVDGHCVEIAVGGQLAKNWKQIAARLEGLELQTLVPLYEVVSSTMGREVPTTHVLDARRVVFEPGVGKEFEDSPWELLGVELGGLAFGETAVDLLETPPGRVTVTKVERKKTALKLEVLHESGDKNAIFLDFTRDFDFVQATDVAAALCLVAAADGPVADTP